MTMRTSIIAVRNPVLRGMHPDPSWIWDESRSEVVLVNSSFELTPGLPIHTSRDFATWRHAADAVDTAMARRLLIDGVEDSGGLYAPTIRRIAGRYAIACTVARVNEERALAAGCAPEDIAACRESQSNFVIVADDLAGPWHGPYWVAGAEGIDPDLFEDEDGTVWWTQTRPATNPRWEGQTEIWTQPIDPADWSLSASRPRTVLWRGFGLGAVWAEGPHLYRIGGWTYLMCAEGGTSFEHCETVMRVRSPQGLAAELDAFSAGCAARGVAIEPAKPGERCVVGEFDRLFEPCKRNPVLTHRHLGLGEPIQCVGHADLLRHPRAGWMLACLGVRETPGMSLGEAFGYLGRETFVAPVVWQRDPVSWKLDGRDDDPVRCDDGDDPGWPVVAAELGRLPDGFPMRVDADGDAVGVEWNAGAVVRLARADRGLLAAYNAWPDCGYAADAVADATVRAGDPRLVSVRGMDDCRFVRVDALDFAVAAAWGRELVLVQDSVNRVSMRVDADGGAVADVMERGVVSQHRLGLLDAGEWFGMRLHDNRVEFLAVDGGVMAAAMGEGEAADADAVLMTLRFDLRHTRLLGSRDARFLSTEWAGGFVGCLAGVGPLTAGGRSAADDRMGTEGERRRTPGAVTSRRTMTSDHIVQ